MLDLGDPPSDFTRQPLNLSGNSDEIDKLFEGFLDWCPDFELIVRAGTLYNCDELQVQAREMFPLIAGRDHIGFEMSLDVDKYRCKCSMTCSVPTFLGIHKLIRLFSPPRQGRWGF